MMAHFRATCSINCLPGIRKFVRNELSQMRVKEDTAHQLVLAIDEACANSIIHQHQNDGKTEFDLYLNKNDKNILVIEIKDHGTPFPIDKYIPQDISEIVKDKIKGGLGILLISRIVDKIEVEEKKDHFIYRFTKKVEID